MSSVDFCYIDHTSLQSLMKIFKHIFKYWVRVTMCENRPLHEAQKLNTEQNLMKKQNWSRIIHYLLHYTNMENFKPSEDVAENNKGIKLFQSRLIEKFRNWWMAQAIVTGENKLDFFYKYKKTFTYEKYLDNIPKSNRIHITRLRLSSHCLPIEAMRYRSKKETKIERIDRLCSICESNAMGDEDHYLMECNNVKINKAQTNFLEDVRTKIPQFSNFTNENIIKYCINMKDENTQIPMALYVKDIMEIYKEEIEGSETVEPLINNLSATSDTNMIKMNDVIVTEASISQGTVTSLTNQETRTKYGRRVKKPIRMDL